MKASSSPRSMRLVGRALLFLGTLLLGTVFFGRTGLMAERLGYLSANAEAETTMETTRVSVDSSENEGDGASTLPSVSATGTLVAFVSEATNLVGDDTNGVADVFLKDRSTGTTTCISRLDDGTEANGASTAVAISGDGRFIAFTSSATNLVPGDTNGKSDIFVYDVAAHTIDRVSVASSEVQSRGESDNPAISYDGRYVAFWSASENLVGGDANGVGDIFLRDRQSGTTARVSVASSGVEGAGESSYPAISADGNIVAFASLAANLVTGDSNNCADIFLRNCTTGETTRASLSGSNTQALDGSYRPSVSQNGRFVAFYSRASNLVSNDTNEREDVFVRDTVLNQTTRVSIPSGTTGEGNGESGLYGLAISADGRFVAFQSYARNLVSGDTNGKGDIFVRDLQNLETSRISIASSSTQANEASSAPAISANGQLIVFDSQATNLINNDGNTATDVFAFRPGVNYRPDLLIGVHQGDGDTTMVGGGIYTQGDAQTVETKVNTGVEGIYVDNTATTADPNDLVLENRYYAVKVQNNARKADTFTLRGDKAVMDSGWIVSYLDPANNDITTAMTTTGWDTPALGVDESVTIQVHVKTYASLPSCAPCDLTITATSKADITRLDYVRCITTLKPLPTSRASVGPNGIQDGSGIDPAFSGNGRYAVWRTEVSLDPRDTGGTDVYVHDRLTGITTLVSVSYDGTSAAGGDDPDISGDGRYIAFRSNSNRLINGVSPAALQIFIYDQQTKNMSLGSIGTDNLPADAACGNGMLCGDAAAGIPYKLTFYSSAKNLVAGYSAGRDQIFIRDFATRTTSLLSKNSSNQPASSTCQGCAISPNGKYVTFRTTSDNLAGNIGGILQLFVIDTETGACQVASMSSTGTLANTAALQTSRAPVADDGTVAFTSSASNLVAGDTNGKVDVFVRDIVHNTTICVSNKADDTPNDQDCNNPTMNRDGRYIAFDTPGRLLPKEDVDSAGDIYIYDRQAAEGNRLQIMSLTYENKHTTGGCVDPFISADGRYIAFQGTGSNLVPGNISGNNIYVRDRWNIQPDALIAAPSEGAPQFVGANDYLPAVQMVGYTNFAGQTTVFPLRVENDGGVSDSFHITGTGDAEGWQVKYYDGLGDDAVDITAAVTGNGWNIEDMPANSSRQFRMEVTSDALLTSAAPPYDVRVTVTSASSAAAQDRVIARNHIRGICEVDMLIRNPQDALYAGDDIRNTVEGQTKAQTVPNETPTTYFLKVQNDGTSGDQYMITGDASSEGWNVAYYVGQQNITGYVTDRGWPTSTMAIGDSIILRLEVTPLQPPAGQEVRHIQVYATSLGDPTKTDLVKASTTAEKRQQPDLMIRNAGVTSYKGAFVYNTSGYGQSVAQTIKPGVWATYQMKVKNDAGSTDDVTLTGTGSVNGWLVKYYDALIGGNDITQQVTGGGWTLAAMPASATRDFRVEITTNSSDLQYSESAVRVKAVSASTALADIVQANTSLPRNGTTRASEQTGGIQATGASYSPAISGNGRYVAFASEASDLVPNDTNNAADVFLYDRLTGTTTRISSAGAGREANNWSDSPAISANGRYIVYRSAASNLVPNDTNSRIDIFLFDRENSSTTMVNISNSGVKGNYDSWHPTMSADGRYIAFASYASNLVANDTNNNRDIFLRDRIAGTTTRISVRKNSAGQEIQANGYCDSPVISADGNAVAFRTTATNLVDGDTNNLADIFVWTRDTTQVGTITGTLTRVSVSSTGEQGNGLSGYDSEVGISGDGKLIAFASAASNLVSGDTNGYTDIFLHNLTTHTTTCVSKPAMGTANQNSGYRSVVMSANGRFVAYASKASNLAPGDYYYGYSDVFLYDVLTGVTERASLTLSGEEANGDSGTSPLGISISADARFVAFDSLATNMTGKIDDNGVSDIFIRDRSVDVPGAYQVDMMIRADGDTTFTGEDIYNMESAQTRGLQTGTDAQTTYYLKIAAKGFLADSYLVTGDSGSRGWTVKYYNGETDITSAVTRSGWTSPALSTNTSLTLRLVVSADSTVDLGAAQPIRVTATSTNFLTRTDTVKAVTTKAALSSVRLLTSLASPQPIGTAVTLTAIPAGGKDIEYLFRYGYVEEGQWHWEFIRGYDPSPTYTWTTPNIAKPYTLVVWAREVGSPVDFDVYQSATYIVTAPQLTTVNIAASPATRAVRNSVVTITASTADPLTAEYKFRIGYKIDSTWFWSTLQNYSTTNVATWMPDESREYYLNVYARTLGRTNAYDLTATQKFMVTEPITAVSLSASPAATSPVNTPIKLTATPVGGANIEYKFMAGYPVDGKWQWETIPNHKPDNSLAEYATNNVVTWTPTVPRTYSLLVYAREEGTTVAYKVYKTLSYIVTSPITDLKVTFTPGPPQRVNTPVTMTVAAVGGSKVLYRYRVGYIENGTWVWPQEFSTAYSTTTTFTWTPTEARQYTVAFYAKDTTSTKSYDIYRTYRYIATAP